MMPQKNESFPLLTLMFFLWFFILSSVCSVWFLMVYLNKAQIWSIIPEFSLGLIAIGLLILSGIFAWLFSIKVKRSFFLPQEHQQQNVLIIWDKGLYNLGIKEIDRQHKILVNIINNLHRCIMTQKCSETIIEIMAQLGDYSVFHFAYEEKLLEKNNCPHLAAQQKYHQGFVEKITKYRNMLFDGDDSLISEEILEYLKNWLLLHILIEDRRDVAFMSNKKSNAASEE